jgi:phosphoribosylamine-glycine ligase
LSTFEAIKSEYRGVFYIGFIVIAINILVSIVLSFLTWFSAPPEGETISTEEEEDFQQASTRTASAVRLQIIL